MLRVLCQEGRCQVELRVCPVQCSHKCPGGERACAVGQQSSQLRAINTKDGSNTAGELQRG